MTSDADLVARLASTLVTKAEEITMPKTQFDPTRRPSVDLDDDRPLPAAPGAPRRWALAAAAAVVVAVAAAGVVVLSGDDPADRTGQGQDVETEPEATTPPTLGDDPAATPPPEGALLPTWLPDGMAVWGVEWTVGPASGGEWGADTVQLFGNDAGAALVVRISPANPGGIPVGETRTVRGQQADVLPAKYFPDTTTEMNWQEDATVVAGFRGMSVDEAVAFLDGLEWRSSNHQEGFVPPQGGPLTLLGEAEPYKSDTPTVTVHLDVRSSPDAGGESGQVLDILTTTATGEQTSAYLMNWFYGGVTEAGIAERYEADFGNLVQAWPDGQSVWIDSLGTIQDRETVERIAESIRPTTSADLAGMRDDTRLRLLNLPVVASAELPSGSRLQLHGTADTWWLCVQPAGTSAMSCGHSSSGGVSGTSSPLLSVEIDGVWYVGGASNLGEPALRRGGFSAPGGGEGIAAETGTDGDWTFALAQPADDVDAVGVTVGDQGEELRRPG